MPRRSKYAKSGVYKITNLVNGKFYIGGTLDLGMRQYHHFWRSSNIPLRRAMAKYGKENFQFEVLEECSSNEVWIREQHYLNLYFDSCQMCYNTSPTAQSQTGLKHSEETKRKISESKRAQKLRHGPKSPEVRAKISRAHQGKTVSQKELERIRAFRHKPESNKKNREAHIKVRPFKLISPDGTLHEGDNVRLFSEQMGLVNNKIWSVLTGERESHKGWRSGYSPEEQEILKEQYPTTRYSRV